MNPKKFTEKQKVRVIYDPNGMHIREEDVYGLMQKYADQQLILHGVTHSSLINDDGSCHTITDGYTTWSKKCTQCKKLSMQVVRVGKVQCCYCG